MAVHVAVTSSGHLSSNSSSARSGSGNRSSSLLVLVFVFARQLDLIVPVRPLVIIVAC